VAVGVVGQHALAGGDDESAVLGGAGPVRAPVGVGVVGGDGRLVLGRDGHRDRGRRRAAGAVRDRVGEGVGAVDVAEGGVGATRVGAEHAAAEGLRLGPGGDLERVAGVAVVGGHLDGLRGVLRSGLGVVVGHRRVGDRRDHDGGHGGGGAAVPIGDEVLEVGRPAVVRSGDEPAALGAAGDAAAVDRLDVDDLEDVAGVGVGVVAGDRHVGRGVLLGDRAVGVGHRRVVDRVDLDGDGGRGGGGAAVVGDRVGEGVLTEVVVGRPVVERP